MRKKQALPTDGLSAMQRDAIRLLASGCTAKYTALVLKLDYANVRRWIKQDVQFQTELDTQYEKQRAQSAGPKSKSEKRKTPANKGMLTNPRVERTGGD
jgi:hypothetical protein